ncbi:autotransporter-associated beta strand repeat-containing protein [Paraburkholderia guartelaensis]|uniref:autotransporter-associated beta strand repeat-containing protein n=1 Tax=Paraburkholderia guartelaensis TaxID=2546446 RepID=UPI001FE594E8|nr:autotransporter-associated beta strand repeat-containing protein [Paraburkholderia guartelaensis]
MKKLVRTANIAAVFAVLLAGSPSRAADLTWDPNGGASGAGGSGTWDTTTPSWNGGTAIWNNATPDNAIFGGAAGTVSLSVPITVQNLTFNVGGYTITGGNLTLGGTNPTITTTGTNSAIINSAIAGTAGLVKSGTGTLVLTGTNTYTGGTTISAGTLQLGNGGTSGSIVGNVTDNGTLAVNNSSVLVLPGVISGSGGVTQIGRGTTVVTGANTYTGGTTISAGRLQLGNGGTTGSIVGDVADN